MVWRKERLAAQPPYCIISQCLPERGVIAIRLLPTIYTWDRCTYNKAREKKGWHTFGINGFEPPPLWQINSTRLIKQVLKTYEHPSNLLLLGHTANSQISGSRKLVQTAEELAWMSSRVKQKHYGSGLPRFFLLAWRCQTNGGRNMRAFRFDYTLPEI